MYQRVFIFITIPLLVLTFLIAPNVVPATQIKSLSDHVASVEPQKESRDLEKDLSDNIPIPDWLSSVLNWIPSDNHDLGAAAFEQEVQNLSALRLGVIHQETCGGARAHGPDAFKDTPGRRGIELDDGCRLVGAETDQRTG